MSDVLPIIDNSWYVKIPSVAERICAGGVVARSCGKEVLIAFTKEESYPQFVLPKGGVDPGETLQQAAIREIKEETGLIEIELLCKLGVRERLSFDKTRWSVVHYFLFSTSQIVGIPLDSDHHCGVWWFPIDQLPPMLWPEQKELIESQRQKIITEFTRRRK